VSHEHDTVVALLIALVVADAQPSDIELQEWEIPKEQPEPTTPDFTVENHGTIVLVVPNNIEAKNALVGCIDSEAQWFAGALVAEPRYVGDIARHLQSNGFTVAE